MNKAESYLYERLDLLSDEKVILITKINEIDLEIEEIEFKVKDLKRDIDDAFEVFSPRSKKNDFVKGEVEAFEKKLEELSIFRNQYNEQIRLVSEDINVIREALGEENEEDFSCTPVEREKDIGIDSINIIKDQELERKRIARELHDSTVQVLTNLVHKCEICIKVMDVDSVRAKLELEVMTNTLRDTINDLRNTIYNLRPMSFDDIGLDVTIARVISQAKKNTDIEIKFAVEGEKFSVGEIESLTLVRILQESIGNSIKHSKGQNINVELKYADDRIVLKISDDGQGFDAAKLKRPEDNNLSGFGLSMMKERVYLLGGRIEITSESGKGTHISAVIPVIKEKTK